MFQRLAQYFTQHPYVKAALFAVESAAAAAFIERFTSGQLDLSAAGLKKLALAMGIAGAYGFRQWLKTSPFAPKPATPVQPAVAPVEAAN